VKDDALSPVVAVMLLLAIAVTLFSLWNSIYLPGLKQQAEVGHLKQVEEAFFRIDGEVATIISRQWEGTTVINVPLGGGDILLHSTRSGGVLEIEDDSPVLTIWNGSSQRNIGLVKITYTPLFNFWVNQSYRWQRGCTNVTKGRTTTWATDTSEEEVRENRYRPLASNLISGDNGKIVITSLIKRESSRVTGNALAQMQLKGNVTEETINATEVTIQVIDPRSPFGDEMNSSAGYILEKYGFSYAGDGNYAKNGNGSITFRFYTITVSVT